MLIIITNYYLRIFIKIILIIGQDYTSHEIVSVGPGAIDTAPLLTHSVFFPIINVSD